MATMRNKTHLMMGLGSAQGINEMTELMWLGDLASQALIMPMGLARCPAIWC